MNGYAVRVKTSSGPVYMRAYARDGAEMETLVRRLGWEDFDPTLSWEPCVDYKGPTPFAMLPMISQVKIRMLERAR